MKIRKSFQDHKTMSNQQIFLKFPNKLEIGEFFLVYKYTGAILKITTRLCKLTISKEMY